MKILIESELGFHTDNTSDSWVDFIYRKQLMDGASFSTVEWAVILIGKYNRYET